MIFVREIQQVMASYWWVNKREAKNSLVKLEKHPSNYGVCFITRTLVARLLKARYYKDCSILEASLGNSPSYV
ncbi:hypothetical protein Prudu_008795 [Prunus dulcis]|uniref:Uncharacterized protein n=1 Tax=Prunus dulcis TaxID=3755 RepID=A0A4Y1R4Z5_PRUDU|nr:hypothetical protein Prudu_008795 [Prunus dulcis]